MVFIPDSVGYLLGTNFFGPIAYNLGCWRVAVSAMMVVGLSTVLVSYAPLAIKVVARIEIKVQTGHFRNQSFIYSWRFFSSLQHPNKFWGLPHLLTAITWFIPSSFHFFHLH
jgi:hypothetical protein